MEVFVFGTEDFCRKEVFYCVDGAAQAGVFPEEAVAFFEVWVCGGYEVLKILFHFSFSFLYAIISALRSFSN